MLISGRWFRQGVTGPWPCHGKALPADFAKIRRATLCADVLFGAGQAAGARGGDRQPIPQNRVCAARRAADAGRLHGGEPQWKPVDGTPLTYAFKTGTSG